MDNSIGGYFAKLRLLVDKGSFSSGDESFERLTQKAHKTAEAVKNLESAYGSFSRTTSGRIFAPTGVEGSANAESKDIASDVKADRKARTRHSALTLASVIYIGKKVYDIARWTEKMVSSSAGLTTNLTAAAVKTGFTNKQTNDWYWAIKTLNANADPNAFFGEASTLNKTFEDLKFGKKDAYIELARTLRMGGLDANSMRNMSNADRVKSIINAAIGMSKTQGMDKAQAWLQNAMGTNAVDIMAWGKSAGLGSVESILSHGVKIPDTNADPGSIDTWNKFLAILEALNKMFGAVMLDEMKSELDKINTKLQGKEFQRSLKDLAKAVGNLVTGIIDISIKVVDAFGKLNDFNKGYDVTAAKYIKEHPWANNDLLRGFGGLVGNAEKWFNASTVSKESLLGAAKDTRRSGEYRISIGTLKVEGVKDVRGLMKQLEYAAETAKSAAH